jgi:hypothetical protein
MKQKFWLGKSRIFEGVRRLGVKGLMGEAVAGT